VIETTPAEQWTERTDALETLVSYIPEAGSLLEHEPYWFNSPKTLRHLAIPLSSLLTDARSTVVKRTCESCTKLFDRCGKDARYLLKDIMPAIISVHAQTVHVIRNYVQNMVADALTKVPCKAAMPIWLDRLKNDKSRTVREACAVYLALSLQSWKDEEGYLTNEIWNQVGTSMIRSLRDPSPSVRDYVKECLEIFRAAHPELWETLIGDPGGPASNDPKLRRFLLRMGDEGVGQDDLSVASRGSVASLASNRSSRHRRPDQVPQRKPRSGLGPPMRITTGARFSPQRERTRSSSPESLNGRLHVAASFDAIEESPFVAGVTELKKQASERRGRRSSIMKDRWSRTSLGDKSEEDIESEAGKPPEPEHLVIAKKLLSAHKKAVDSTMEILRLEMDTLEDFERNVKSRDPNKPSEEDVLTYFEALGMCLDKRSEVAKELQSAMDSCAETDREQGELGTME
jgi:hypothetical protein